MMKNLILCKSTFSRLIFDIQEKMADGDLIYAIRAGNYEAVESSIDQGVDLNAKNRVRRAVSRFLSMLSLLGE